MRRQESWIPVRLGSGRAWRDLRNTQDNREREGGPGDGFFAYARVVTFRTLGGRWRRAGVIAGYDAIRRRDSGS